MVKSLNGNASAYVPDKRSFEWLKVTSLYLGVELRANLKLISHRCFLFKVAFEWEWTKETIHLPLGCLQD